MRFQINVSIHVEASVNGDTVIVLFNYIMVVTFVYLYLLSIII